MVKKTVDLPCATYLVRQVDATKHHETMTFIGNYVANLHDIGMSSGDIVGKIGTMCINSSGVAELIIDKWGKWTDAGFVDKVLADGKSEGTIAVYSCDRYYLTRDPHTKACLICPRSPKYACVNRDVEVALLWYMLKTQGGYGTLISYGVTKEHFRYMVDLARNKVKALEPLLIPITSYMFCEALSGICDSKFKYLEEAYSYIASVIESQMTEKEKNDFSDGFKASLESAIVVYLKDLNECSVDADEEKIKEYCSILVNYKSPKNNEGDIIRSGEKVDLGESACKAAYKDVIPKAENTTPAAAKPLNEPSDGTEKGRVTGRTISLLTVEQIVSNLEDSGYPKDVSVNSAVQPVGVVESAVITDSAKPVVPDEVDLDDAKKPAEAIVEKSSPVAIDDKDVVADEGDNGGESEDEDSNNSRSVYLPEIVRPAIDEADETDAADRKDNNAAPVIEVKEIFSERVTDTSVVYFGKNSLVSIPVVSRQELNAFCICLDKNDRYLSVLEAAVLKDKRMFIELCSVTAETKDVLMLYVPTLHQYFYSSMSDPSNIEVISKLLGYNSIHKLCYMSFVMLSSLHTMGIRVKNIHSISSAAFLFANKEWLSMEEVLLSLKVREPKVGVDIRTRNENVSVESVALKYMHGYYRVYMRLKNLLVSKGLWLQYETQEQYDNILGVSFLRSYLSKEQGYLFQLNGFGRYDFPATLPTEFKVVGKRLSLTMIHSPISIEETVRHLLKAMYETGLLDKAQVQLLSLRQNGFIYFVSSRDEEYVMLRINNLVISHMKEIRSRGVEYRIDVLK